MTRLNFTMFFPMVVFLWLLNVSTGDTEVSCVFMERCILPCSFSHARDIVIHWIQETAGNPRVHSFYHNQDQFALQNQRFRYRTSLFKDQISRGNASLQLTGVKVSDEGRYKCYTSTVDGNKESFISLKVNAPVHEVNIQQVENRITCSSEGIYPKPELTWSPGPSSDMALHYNTTVQQTEQQLYNINSDLIAENDNDLMYSCTVSTHKNMRKVTLSKQTLIVGSYMKTIPCSAFKTSPMRLIWRFNHSQVFLNKTDSIYTVSEDWRQHVKDVSESGNLTLQGLSSEQEGIYTCEISDDVEMMISETFVRIRLDNSNNAPSFRAGVIAAILVLGLAVTGLVFYIVKIKKVNKGMPTNDETKIKMELEDNEVKASMNSDTPPGINQTSNNIYVRQSKEYASRLRSLHAALSVPAQFIYKGTRKKNEKGAM